MFCVDGNLEWHYAFEILFKEIQIFPDFVTFRKVIYDGTGRSEFGRSINSSEKQEYCYNVNPSPIVGNQIRDVFQKTRN